VKHLDWLQFHLPVIYKVVGSLLQDMHLCFSLDAVCTICGELKAPNVRPRSYALALTSLKANDCIPGVIEPNADADDLASFLNAFVDSGRFSAVWFLSPSKNVFSGKPSFLLPYKLLAEGPWKALLLSDIQYIKALSSSSISNEELRVRDSFVAIGLCAPCGMLLFAQDSIEVLTKSDDWSYVADGFAQEIYPQVLSAFYPPSSAKKMERRCVESKIHGDGPKHSNSLAGNVFQHAIKFDGSQFFSCMGSKSWSMGLLKIFGLTKYHLSGCDLWECGFIPIL